MTLIRKFSIAVILITITQFFLSYLNAEEEEIYLKSLNDQLQVIVQDLKTLEKAVYKKSDVTSSTNLSTIDGLNEDILTKHLLKLNEIEDQFRELTNRFEEVSFKLDKLSTRVTKIQSDTQLRFSDLETGNDISKKDAKKILPGSSKPQDFGANPGYQTSNLPSKQEINSIESAQTVIAEEPEKKDALLPDKPPNEQYEFAVSFMKIGDYETAEFALKEFIEKNRDHDLAGSAQYWYGETFRIRQLYSDAATAYLDGYQNYPKSKKAPDNLLKLGITMVQLGEKDQGCKMISGLKKNTQKLVSLCYKKLNMSKKNSSANRKKDLRYSKAFNEVYLSFKKKLNTLKKKSYVIAVSGGPDSLALVSLSKIYAEENKVKFYYILVNHNIRKNSLKEAREVQYLLKKNKLNLVILNNKYKFNKNIQSNARKVRYELLSNFCVKSKVRNIITAHNLEDQVETFLIRLSRGSGLKGLSSMKFATKIENNISLIRPLLDIKKKLLIKISNLTFGKYIRDPSNKDKKFLRTKIRNLQTHLKKSGINYDQIIMSINNLASSNEILENYFKEKFSKGLIKSKKSLIIKLNNFLELETEFKIRVINNAIKELRKNYYNPRSKKVKLLIENLEKKNFLRATLGGCIFSREKDKISLKIEKK